MSEAIIHIWTALLVDDPDRQEYTGETEVEVFATEIEAKQHVAEWEDQYPLASCTVQAHTLAIPAPEASTVHILRAEHKSVPGIRVRAFATPELAEAGRDELRKEFGRELEYVTIEHITVERA